MAEHQFKKIVNNEPPKRPMSAYFLFLKDIRTNLFKDNPGSSVAEVSKLAGYKYPYISEQWRNIDPDDKLEYQRQADIIRKEYLVVKAEFETKNGPIKRKRKLKRGFENRRTNYEQK